MRRGEGRGGKGKRGEGRVCVMDEDQAEAASPYIAPDYSPTPLTSHRSGGNKGSQLCWLF